MHSSIFKEAKSTVNHLETEWMLKHCIIQQPSNNNNVNDIDIKSSDSYQNDISPGSDKHTAETLVFNELLITNQKMFGNF